MFLAFEVSMKGKFKLFIKAVRVIKQEERLPMPKIKTTSEIKIKKKEQI